MTISISIVFDARTIKIILNFACYLFECRMKINRKNEDHTCLFLSG